MDYKDYIPPKYSIKTKAGYFNYDNWKDFIEAVKEMIIEKAIQKGLNRYKTILRRRKLIKEFYEKYDNVKFVTITLDNKHINTKKRAITTYLKRKGLKYILVEENGEKKGRRHYHGLISGINAKEEDINNYGLVDIQDIRNKENVIDYIAKYTTKNYNKSRIVKNY